METVRKRNRPHGRPHSFLNCGCKIVAEIGQQVAACQAMILGDKIHMHAANHLGGKTIQLHPIAGGNGIKKDRIDSLFPDQIL